MKPLTSSQTFLSGQNHQMQNIKKFFFDRQNKDKQRTLIPSSLMNTLLGFKKKN
jgi:hypothetical protein